MQKIQLTVGPQVQDWGLVLHAAASGGAEYAIRIDRKANR